MKCRHQVTGAPGTNHLSCNSCFFTLRGKTSSLFARQEKCTQHVHTAVSPVSVVNRHDSAPGAGQHTQPHSQISTASLSRMRS